MRRRRGEAYLSPDWAIRASSFEFRLSAEEPFVARLLRYPEPTPLRVGVHDGLEYGVLLSGRVEQHYGDYVFDGKAGDVWLVSMWEPHLWRVTEAPAEQVAVVFLPEFIGEGMRGSGGILAPFACAPNARPMSSDPERRRAILAIGRELREELEERARGWENAVRLATEKLLFTVTRGWKAPTHASRTPASGWSSLARLMPALEAVHARPAARVSLASAAAACRLSTPHFSRVFRQMMGLSFAKFRLRARLAYAARLLLTTGLPTEAVAAQAGFVDGSHLHRSFVRRYGTTPGQYRKEGRYGPQPGVGEIQA